MKGTVFNIQRFSINDGPGIRTTVFLKGCPLSCIWCHNPESKLTKREVLFNKSKCITCGACGVVCDNRAHVFEDGEHSLKRDLCIACGRCADVCPMKGLEAVGEENTVEEVLITVMKDKIFYDTSGGGLTVSGGEPMLQFDFTYDLLKSAKEKGLHTCMETCGFAEEERYIQIAKHVDIFLFDYKETDPMRHKEYTGVSNERILKNLRAIDEIGAKMILRCPIIPTLNDRTEHFEGIARVANSLKNVIEINVEPYHPLGMGKSEMLGKDYPLKDITYPTESAIEEWMNTIRKYTKFAVKKA